MKTVDDILFGTYQAYKIDTLHPDLLLLDEEKIKHKIRISDDKSPEKMLFDLLHHQKNGVVKDKSLLDVGGNIFGMSHSKISSGMTAWCVPFWDQLTNQLGFVVWNMEEPEKDIEITLVYNDEQVINLGVLNPKHWTMRDIDDYDSAKKLVVLLNGEIRNVFDFEKEGDQIKEVSYREAHKKK